MKYIYIYKNEEYKSVRALMKENFISQSKFYMLIGNGEITKHHVPVQNKKRNRKAYNAQYYQKNKQKFKEVYYPKQKEKRKQKVSLNTPENTEMA